MVNVVRFLGWVTEGGCRRGLGVLLVGGAVLGAALLALALVIAALVGGIAALVGLGASLAAGMARSPLDMLIVHLSPLLVAGYVWLWISCTLRTLRSRQTWAVLPPPTLPLSLGAIEAFASTVIGLRRRRLAWLDRPASALRVELTTTADGRSVYLWSVPSRLAGALQTAASCYPGLEFHPAERVLGRLPQLPPDRAWYIEREEWRPAREPIYTFREAGPHHDPLQSVAHALERAVPGLERPRLVVDILPLAPREQGHLRERLIKHAERRWGGGGRRGQAANPAHGLRRTLQVEALRTKIVEAPPLYKLQILAETRSALGRDRAKSLMGGLRTALEQSSGHNFFRSRGWSGLALGSNLPGLRWWFDVRLEHGLFGHGLVRHLLRLRPSTRHTVSDGEVWWLLKPWTELCYAPRAVRRSELAPPPEGRPAVGLVVCQAPGDEEVMT